MGKILLQEIEETLIGHGLETCIGGYDEVSQAIYTLFDKALSEERLRETMCSLYVQYRLDDTTKVYENCKLIAKAIRKEVLDKH